MPRKHRTILFVSFVLCIALSTQAHTQENTLFSRLPSEVRSHVETVRGQCREFETNFKPRDPMVGIDFIDLEGTGSKSIVVDDRALCDGLVIAGGNCSNRGCDIRIWKQDKSRKWREVLNEHARQQFVLKDHDNDRFKLMIISIYVGDPRCKPDPKRNYTSGMSCDIIARYKRGNWTWELVP